MLNVTYVIPAPLDAAGGHIQHVAGLCRNAEKSGVSVRLICLKGRSDVPKFDFPVTFLDSGSGGAFFRISRFCRLAIQEIAKGERPGFIYTRPFPMDYPLFLRWVCDRRIPYAYELNTLWANELRSQNKPLKALIYPWIEKQSIRRASALLSVTNEIAQYAGRFNSESPTLVAGNGVQLYEVPPSSRADLRVKWKLPTESRLVVMAGFTRPWHGFEKLLYATKLLPDDFHIVLVGSNSAATRSVQEICEKLRIGERVHVLPWLSHSEVNEVIYACDVGVSSLSMDSMNLAEAQSLKARQYLAMGRPVLTSVFDRALEGPEFVSRIDSNSIAAIANGIVSLASDRSDEVTIREFAISNLSWEAIASKTWKFLRTVSERGKG